MKPLVVDLDGTLLKTDVAVEAANAAVVRYPARTLLLLAGLTRRLEVDTSATAALPDAAVLPWHEELLNWLREQATQGRELILISSSPSALLAPLVSHLGIFTGVHAQLRGAAKHAALVRAYGIKGFDYVGSSPQDLPIWRDAQCAYVVSNSSALIEQLRASGNLCRVFCGHSRNTLHTILHTLRPHQWAKNVLLFVPLITAHRYRDLHSIALACLGFVVFCLAASSVYVLNDLLDVPHDRAHSRKRLRPFASGEVSLRLGWCLWPMLLVAALALGFVYLPTRFLAELGTYAAFTLMYSLYLKKIAMVDVLILAGLYTLRITAGIAVLAVPLSYWLMSFSLFFFLSLAFIKRHAELRAASDAGYKGELRGRGYRAEDLSLVATAGLCSGYLSVLVLALYIEGNSAALLYSSPQRIWVACPLLLFWISRAWMLAHRGEMPEDPLLWAIRDRLSRWMAAGFCAIVLLARFLP